MTEQQRPVLVAICCWPCHGKYGPAPLLGIVERDADGSWWVSVVRRPDYSHPLARSARSQGGQRGRPAPINPAWKAPRGSRLLLLHAGMASVQMDCSRRNCMNRPREARAKLVDCAKEAAARGERIIYAPL